MHLVGFTIEIRLKYLNNFTFFSFIFMRESSCSNMVINDRKIKILCSVGDGMNCEYGACEIIWREFEFLVESLRFEPICPQEIPHRLVQDRAQIRQEAALIINP